MNKLKSLFTKVIIQAVFIANNKLRCLWGHQNMQALSWEVQDCAQSRHCTRKIKFFLCASAVNFACAITIQRTCLDIQNWINRVTENFLQKLNQYFFLIDQIMISYYQITFKITDASSYNLFYHNLELHDTFSWIVFYIFIFLQNDSVLTFLIFSKRVYFPHEAL